MVITDGRLAGRMSDKLYSLLLTAVIGSFCELGKWKKSLKKFASHALRRPVSDRSLRRRAGSHERDTVALELPLLFITARRALQVLQHVVERLMK